MAKAVKPPKCDYCGKPSELVTGAQLYPNHPNFATQPYYKCWPCEAWVGCHDGTLAPLGRLANKELRMHKGFAHAAFDPLWKRKADKDCISRGHARSKGYKWLAKSLGIEGKDCHIGMFDVAQCKEVVRLCRERKPLPQS